MKQYFLPDDVDIASEGTQETSVPNDDPPAPPVNRRPAAPALETTLIGIYQTIVDRPTIRITPMKKQLEDLLTTGSIYHIGSDLQSKYKNLLRSSKTRAGIIDFLKNTFQDLGISLPTDIAGEIPSTRSVS